MDTQEVSVIDLVARAAAGDQRAWNELVDRYLPLVLSVLRSYRMTDKDTEDVSQTVWLRLVENLARIREPLALPAWLIRTARNEALRVQRQRGKAVAVDPVEGSALDRVPEPADVDGELLQAERDQAVREGLALLTSAQRGLLLLLVADPPLSYETIGRQLGMAIGSIGPTRARCLAKLRATPAVQALLGDDRARTSTQTGFATMERGGARHVPTAHIPASMGAH